MDIMAQKGHNLLTILQPQHCGRALATAWIPWEEANDWPQQAR